MFEAILYVVLVPEYVVNDGRQQMLNRSRSATLCLNCKEDYH